MALKNIDLKNNMGLNGVPELIAFFGVDGSGKTTQVMMLSELLKRKGVRFKRIWIRSPHGIAYYVWRLLVKIGFTRVIENKFGLKLELPRLTSKSHLSRLWSWFELFNILPIIFLRVIIPAKLGYKLLAERYVPDTIVTMAYFIQDAKLIFSRISKILFTLIPKNSVFIHLRCNYEELLRRRGEITEPKKSSSFQRHIYDILSERLGAVNLDTSKLTILETHQIIVYELFGKNEVQPIRYEIRVPQPKHSLKL